MTNTRKVVRLKYESFDQVQGKHPWREVSPNGFIDYKIRRLNYGSIAYFNFDLAKQMGLIDENHPHKMNPVLEKKILDTFNIRIINEYDINKNKFTSEALAKPLMATRYLQLQHKNKKGETSGDGRGIWNGHLEHNGVEWDISSRGTGVTRLAPGAVESERPLKTGCTTFGYGCGLVEIDELFASVISSELLLKQKIETEQVLCIIDHGKGVGIGVRAGKNLIRPAHLFRFLKLNDLKSLRSSVDYLVNRDIKNGNFKFSKKNLNRNQEYLKYLCHNFAKFTARLERLYIFTWLAWDGDNVMANSGIIDYGSIRQFGLRHDQYRYDDVDRFSTTLNEQKTQAKYLLQTYIQIFDFLLTGKKQSITKFKKHVLMNEFEEVYNTELLKTFLWQVGLYEEQIEQVLTNKKPLVKKLFKKFEAIEKIKVNKTETLPDGINRPASINALNLLRELPLYFLTHTELKVKAKWLADVTKTHVGKEFSFSLNTKDQKKLVEFTKAYTDFLLNHYGNKDEVLMACPDISHNAEKRTPSNRPTGNAINLIVYNLIEKRKHGLTNTDTQEVIDAFLKQFNFDADVSALTMIKSSWSKTFQSWMQILEDRAEDI